MFDGPDVLKLTARIAAAHLSRNQVAPDALPALIQGVYGALAGAGTATPEAQAQAPAVPARRSVFPGHLVYLEDGKRLATLKHHLRSEHGLTPERYRTKWGLPASYPMAAPDDAGRRSATAKKIGLGHKAVAPPRGRKQARSRRCKSFRHGGRGAPTDSSQQASAHLFRHPRRCVEPASTSRPDRHRNLP